MVPIETTEDVPTAQLADRNVWLLRLKACFCWLQEWRQLWGICYEESYFLLENRLLILDEYLNSIANI